MWLGEGACPPPSEGRSGRGGKMLYVEVVSIADLFKTLPCPLIWPSATFSRWEKESYKPFAHKESNGISSLLPKGEGARQGG